MHNMYARMSLLDVMHIMHSMHTAQRTSCIRDPRSLLTSTPSNRPLVQILLE